MLDSAHLGQVVEQIASVRVGVAVRDFYDEPRSGLDHKRRTVAAGHDVGEDCALEHEPSLPVLLPSLKGIYGVEFFVCYSMV